MSNKVSVTKEFMETLSKLAKVNQTLKLPQEADTLKSKNVSQTMLVRAPITQKIPRDAHIYDLPQFISIIKVFEDPELDFSNPKIIRISSKDGKQSMNYLEASPENVTSWTDKEPPIASKVFSVKVSEVQLKKTLIAAATMGLKNVGFFGDGERIKLVAFDKNNGDQKERNIFSIDLGESNEDFNFKMFYDTENHGISHILDEGDMEVEVYANKISKFTTASGKVFLCAMDAKSTFEKIGD